jgi:DNA polymerase III subunit gamma/tau
LDYRVLALKYRPGRFEEIVGQDSVTSVLAGAIEQNRLAQAYLFSGPRGCGKTSSARILAKALNCEQGPTPSPCGDCESCRAITAGGSLAVIEIDAASTGGVDGIRAIREEAALGSIGGRYKVYILDEAHQISGAGANALLKTLEEPPPNTVFVLATTEPQKIIPTIHSRCQRFQFRLLSVGEIAGRLAHICGEEEIKVEEDVLLAIARRADGSMRDGITLLDQVLASASEDLSLPTVTALLGLTRHDHYYALSQAWGQADGAAALRALDEVLNDGLGPREFALGLARFFRDLLLIRLDPALTEGELGEEDRRRCEELAGQWQVEDLLHLTRLAGERSDQIRYASQPRILLETLVVEIARFESRVLLAELLSRLGAMERGETPPATSGNRATDSRTRRSGGEEPPRNAAPRKPAESRPPSGKPETTPPPAPAPARSVSPAPAPALAPPPASENPAPAAALAAGTDSETIWREFVPQVARGMKSLGSFLEHARPGALGDKHYCIKVENPFHLAMLDTPEHLRLMGETLSSLIGASRQIRLELVSPGASQEQAPPDTQERITKERADGAKREQALRDHSESPLVQDLLQRFDGEVLED